MLVSKVPIPILNAEYAQRRVEHLAMMLDNIYNTGGCIQPSDMQNMTDTLHELKDQLEGYGAMVNQLQEDIAEATSWMNVEVEQIDTD